MYHLCYLCLMFVMLLRLFIAALCSTAEKGLTSWLSIVILNCVFVTIPSCILGQVWYLIVQIPDFCHFSYLVGRMKFVLIEKKLWVWIEPFSLSLFLCSLTLSWRILIMNEILLTGILSPYPINQNIDIVLIFRTFGSIGILNPPM